MGYLGEYCPGFGVLQNLQSARSEIRPHRHRARLCRRTSTIAARAIAACQMLWRRWERVDLVYIDGAHDEEAVFRDVKLWSARVRQGGIVAGHDYSMETMGVAQ